MSNLFSFVVKLVVLCWLLVRMLFFLYRCSILSVMVVFIGWVEYVVLWLIGILVGVLLVMFV